MVYSETFGEWLSYKRKDRGLSQSELARRAKMARATVSLYEKDAIHQPRLHQLDKIADVLDIGHDEIRAAFSSLSINIDNRSADLETYEIMNGVMVGFDRRKANLTAAQRDEIVSVLKLVIKGMSQK